MSEFIINWDNLLNKDRSRESKAKKDDVDNRSAFDSDYSRIIFSSAFRRLQDKAQVFPLEDSDFIRTRLTHSIEVSTIAESIGISIEHYLIDNSEITKYDTKHFGELRKILACVGLLHDIGNTPFGHFGEYAIQNYFKNLFKETKNFFEESKEDICKKNDYIYFDGNAQALRIITYLQSMQYEGGMNLTYGTLSALLKYPRASDEGNRLTKGSENDVSYKKYGYLQSEKEVFEKIIKNTGLYNNEGKVVRNPIAYILEAADDIAYSVSDIEDGIKKGCLTIDYLKKEILEVLYKKYKDDTREETNTCNDQIFNIIKEKGSEEESKLYVKLNEKEKSIIQAFYNQIEFGVENELTRAQMVRVSIQGYMIAAVVNEFIKSYSSIMNGTYEKELLLESDVKLLRIKLKDISIKKIFNNKIILKNELAGEKIITRLLELFLDAILNENEPKSKRLYGLISDNYKECYEKQTNKNKYNKIQLIVDCVSGMTDNYALQLYKQLQGIII